jgi:hypothetical protein
MISKCRGCRYELNEAYFLQELGFHLAIDPFYKGHLFIIMVDDDGKIVVW